MSILNNCWLTEETLNTFVSLCVLQANANHYCDKMYAHFHSQGLPLHLNGSITNHKTILKKDGIFTNYSLVLCPTNINQSHWQLVVIYPQRKWIQGLDSLGQNPISVLNQYEDMIHSITNTQDKWKKGYVTTKAQCDQGFEI